MTPEEMDFYMFANRKRRWQILLDEAWDNLEEDRDYWKKRAIEAEKKHSDLLNDSLKSAQFGSAMLLKAALAGAFDKDDSKTEHKE